MTGALLKEDLLTTDTPPDGHRHYFRKEDLDRNLLDGAAITALCGFVKEGLAHPDTSLPVCEGCHWVYENVVGTGPGAQE